LLIFSTCLTNVTATSVIYSLSLHVALPIFSRFDYLDIPYTDQTMKQFAEVLVSSCEHILSAMKLLSQKKYLQIREHTIEINHLENEGNRLMREGIRTIFTNPRDPYHDFKLKEVYERLERVTDCCEDVADILDSVLLRYA